MWYHIQLGDRHDDSSSIEHEDGSESGWIHRELVSAPKGDVPVEDNRDDGDSLNNGDDEAVEDEGDL
jgi:hypothetical protein